MHNLHMRLRQLTSINALGVGAIAAHLAILCWIAFTSSPTRNEVAHIPAGLAYLESGEFHLYRVNPPLTRIMQALPVWAAGADTSCLIRTPDLPGTRMEWDAAFQFAEYNRHYYFHYIVLARLTGICWTLLGIWVVRMWAKELYGCKAAFLATLLWCFSPSILSHAVMATPDFPCAVLCLSSSLVFHRYLLAPSFSLAAASGILLGVAQLTKFTALIDYLSWSALGLAASILPSRPLYRQLPLWIKGGHVAVIVLISGIVINAGYAFEGSFTPVGAFDFASQSLTVNRNGERINVFSKSLFSGIPMPLPANYIRGLDLQQLDFEQSKLSYLGGTLSDRGWCYFYVYAIFVKVPVGVLLLGVYSMILSLTSSCRRFDDLVVWLPAIVVLTVASLKSGYTMHFRYILPALPFVIIGLSRVAEVACIWCKVGVATLSLSAVLSSALVLPHSLSYFNELVGGPNNGHEHLIDSNIDWGQDLFFFHHWVNRHPESSPIGLAYFNFIDYRVVIGAEYPEVPPDPDGDRERAGPHPGWWAVDIHSLKAGRYKYFDRFRPVAKAGYSIFIYHISHEEADRARRDMGLPPLPVLETTR
jgi:hypothetical protein